MQADRSRLPMIKAGHDYENTQNPHHLSTVSTEAYEDVPSIDFPSPTPYFSTFEGPMNGDHSGYKSE